MGSHIVNKSEKEDEVEPLHPNDPQLDDGPNPKRRDVRSPLEEHRLPHDSDPDAPPAVSRVRASGRPAETVPLYAAVITWPFR